MDLQVLGDRYELLDPIGRGGMATIYRARDQRVDRMVAVKILREMYSNDKKFVLRFQREASSVAALAHPNIVHVYDYGRSDDVYYIVMELVEGVDLRKYLKTNGILDIKRAVVIAHDVALALGSAHRKGIVHRDVKPQNILVNDEGLVKLTDFGIATFYRENSERLTTTGMTLGTVQYYAPEQAQGEAVSPAADVYALGIVLYEMLVGHPPFDGDTPVAIAVRHIQETPVRPSRYNPQIPPPLERIILRCLEKRPEDRYTDGDALAHALETFDRPRSNSQGRVSSPMNAQAEFMNGPGPMNGGGGYIGSSSRPVSGPRNNDYFLGDSDMSFGQGPTRSDFATGTTPRKSSPLPQRPPDEDAPSPAAPITAAIVIASILLVLAASVFLAIHSGLFSSGSTATPTPVVVQVTVPNFVGKTLDDARLSATNLQLHVVDPPLYQTVTDPKQANIILKQDLPAGSSAVAGSSITFTVGQMPNQVIVPDVHGLTADQANQAITAAGLVFSEGQFVFSNLVPAGQVDHTSPQGGTSVSTGSTVIVSISKGPQATATPVATATPAATATAAATATSAVTNTPTAIATATAAPTATCAATPVTGPGTPTPTPKAGC